jgi:hypothetical protein
VCLLFDSSTSSSPCHSQNTNQPKSKQDFIDRSPFGLLLALPCSLGPDVFLRSVLLRHTSRADAWRKLVYQGLLGSVPMLLLIVYFVVCESREVIMFHFEICTHTLFVFALNVVFICGS